ncbi:hypothetical protein HUT16_24825 [Kitasatospora sp. NA04385]|uniref:hypothetical protein n=1 Tax=Kitasatospora sp. NA04385 TaxID=2742135 RepID=UPI00158FF236|nr:hypothetical protein [Kitasatospora sp. NA04385]QKW21851.1 hypothetical protein HUT16_24825 [Kitasatospora sp. NA04385]
MTPHQTHHPTPGPSEDEPGAGVSGHEDENEYGPPDWFAAAAEEPGPEPEPVGPPDWFAAAAEPAQPVAGTARAARPARAAAEEPAAAELPGLVRASELPGGRRRRRSALGSCRDAAADGGAATRPAADEGRAARTDGADGAGR